MADLSRSTENDFFTIRSTTSNEQLIFADSLRDWSDPLLHGQEPIPVPICPRCAICKCQSLKDVHTSPGNSIHYHRQHDKHHPSCPIFAHQHTRAKSSSNQRINTKSKRQAVSHDPSITVLKQSSVIIKPKSSEHIPSLHVPKRKKSTSKIPIRTLTTPLSDYSSITSIIINQSSKIPRPISTRSLPSPTTLSTSSETKLSTDELYELDSLNDDVHRTSPAMSDNEDTSSKKKTKTMINQLDLMDEQKSMKKKKRHKRSTSSPDKRQRRYHHKEGRQPKSKSTLNDLSSSSSSSSSSLSVVPSEKKSRLFRLASPSHIDSSLSDDSLSNKIQDEHRPSSAFISTDQSHYTSQLPSVYRIEVTNQHRPISSLGLTKTITYVWKNQTSQSEKDEHLYSRYSIEKVPPVRNKRTRSIPISSRNIILQRGQTDFWHNLETLSDSIISSSCQNLTGSASYVLSPLSEVKQTTTDSNSNGHIISITTTKRHQPSLLNQTKNIQWNIEGDGKQLRYSKTKWYSADQLHKRDRLARKNRIKHVADSNTDTGSSSEQNNQSAPLLLAQKNDTTVPNEIHEVSEKLPSNNLSKQTDSVNPEYGSINPDIKNPSACITHVEKPSHSLSTPSSKPARTSKPKQISYGSTDEDVDELNSHYSEDIDRSTTTTTVQSYRDKLNTRLFSLTNEQTETNVYTTPRPRILSTEYSQITLDSGVDIGSEQKTYQPHTTLTIDEQSSEEITNRNDLFALSDDSLIEIEHETLNNLSLMDKSDFNVSMNKTELDSFFSAKSELSFIKDPYGGYELESVTDEDEDYPIKKDSNELILTSELPTTSVSVASSSSSSIPSQFEFKLPSFGEWIDRVFTTFLSETNQSKLGSSRSSSIVSTNSSLNTINTSSSSSQAMTVIENQDLSTGEKIDPPNHPLQSQSWSSDERHDEDYSLNDMSSSSLDNEKVDFDTYIINSNYEKINTSITNEQNEILPLNEQSKSLLSSITSTSENVDQEMTNNKRMQKNNDELSSEQFQYYTNSRDSLLQSDHHMDTATSSMDDLTKPNHLLLSTFHSKDSALDLSDEHLDRPQLSEVTSLDDDQQQQQQSSLFYDKTVDDSEIVDNITSKVNDASISTHNTMIYTHDQLDKPVERTISSSSSEQLIPKEKQTGMYYKAFGSSAAIQLAEQYNCEWLQDITTTTTPGKTSEIDDNYLRIVHQTQTLGDDEDEFYFSPQILFSSCSCPNLYDKLSQSLRERSYSLTTLDKYIHLNITHETLEQIWHSLLDIAYSDKDDYDLSEYKLRHIKGLSNSYTAINQTLIEKSRSHNDIFSIMNKNQKLITIKKSKSFDITRLLKHSLTKNESIDMGLLQGADISEPFADQFISTSMHSDLESMQSIEHEQIANENPSAQPPIVKEPLNYVFNYSQQTDDDEFDIEPTSEMEDKPLNVSITFESDGDNETPPMVYIPNTYAELILFRPHSLSTIPSSRASQYASSVDSDDVFDRERNLTNEINIETSEDNYQYHISDDDHHGVIGSEFSSPQSRPLSSIQSRPFTPELNQQSKHVNFSNIDHDAWERSISEPIFHEDLSTECKNREELLIDEQYSNNLTCLIPIETFNHSQSHLLDQIEAVLILNENTQLNFDSNNFIQQVDSSIKQDYLDNVDSIIEEESDKILPAISSDHDIHLDSNELTRRLVQLNSSKKTLTDTQEETINLLIINNKDQVEDLTSSIEDKEHSTVNIKDLKSTANEQKSLIIENVHEEKSLQLPSSVTIRSNDAPARYYPQRIDKVSDLEIVKLGKGFKIGYIDRKGTDQRVILTKRIDIGPDILERDPHVRLPYKGRRILNQMYSSVLYTNGYNTMQEDNKFQHTSDDIEVSIIGTNPKHFDESDMVSIDIDGPSTMLNSICESIVITQGSVYTTNTPSKSPTEKSITQSISNSSSLFESSLTLIPSKKDKIEVIDSWHDHTVINGTSTAWRSPFKPIKHVQPSIDTIQMHNSSSSSLDINHLPLASILNSNVQPKTTRDIALSPILIPPMKQCQSISTSPITICQTVDRSCQYSPPMKHDQGLQCYLETLASYTQVSSHDIPGFLTTRTTQSLSNDNSAFQTYSTSSSENQHGINYPNQMSMMMHPTTTLERSADSGILVDDNHRMKSDLALQVDMKSSSSDSEDISEVTQRPLIRQTHSNMNIYENRTITNTSTNEIEQEILQLRRERAHILDLLSLNWNRSNIWVELTEAKLNYIIGETDALLRSFSYDTTPMSSETVKLKMHQYEDDMAELTRQHLAVYRERLEDSKKLLDMKIDELELKKSSIEKNSTNHMSSKYSNFEHTLRSINKRSQSFLSTSAENLTTIPIQDTIASHPHLLDVSFLTATPSKLTGLPTHFSDHRSNNDETLRTIYRPTPRYVIPNNQQYDYSTRIHNQNNGNLSHMEGLSKSQQAILDETDELIKDSQQLHTESASQFERARESLLSSETSIRLVRANMAASRLSPHSQTQEYLPNDVTLAELFKYEQSLAKEAAKNNRHIYSSTKTTKTES